MRIVHALSTLALMALVIPADASPRIIPQPPPTPLGTLIRESKTIHVLSVEVIGFGMVGFKPVAALKGKLEDAPFKLVKPLKETPGKGAFLAKEIVLCFRQGEVATLHTGGGWILAIEPIAWRGETQWFSMAEDRYVVTYEGATAALREHVVDILVGRETTILARAPSDSEATVGALWRIKAGLNVTGFVVSDESPHFVGWGTGEAEEVTKLAEKLRRADTRGRIEAIGDLAHLGTATRPALPALRRALRDPEHTVALATARALVRLDSDTIEAIQSVQTLLGHAKPKVRVAAAKTIANLGPKASSTLPALLKKLQDKDESVRAAAAGAVGPVAAGSPQEAVAALVALLNREKSQEVWTEAIGSLQCLGSAGWSALPLLKSRLSVPKDDVWGYPPLLIVLLMARFDPPPVELLAAVLLDSHTAIRARQEAAHQLGILGTRARLALPALRQVLQEPDVAGEEEAVRLRLRIAEALLAVDPAGGPALAAPLLLKLGKEYFSEQRRAVSLLGDCGKAARPAIPILFQSLDPELFDTSYTIDWLTPVLTPADREWLPAIRKGLSGDRADPLVLAKVLYQLDYREEALKQAAGCLERKYPADGVEAARWLGKRGKEAQAVEPALRRALRRSSGAKQARIALTLWQLQGAAKAGPRTRALSAIADLLSICEGEPPGVGCISSWNCGCWTMTEYAGSQENDAIAEAVASLHSRVETSDNPVAILSRSVREKDPHIRLAAAVTLARVEPGHADIVPALQRLLGRYPHFFIYAADTLIALGSKASPLAPQILPLLRHGNDDVSRAASRVLRRINPVATGKTWGAAGAPGAVPAKLDPLWDDLASADALCVDLAVWRLAGAGSAAVTLVRERLRMPTTLTPERIDQLIVDLDSRDFAKRQRASSELADAIEAAAPALRRVLAAKPTREQRRRIEALLLGLDPTRSTEQLRRLRTVRLLEEMDSSESRVLLKTLSRGDQRFLLTLEAKFALQRLEAR